MPLIQWMLLQPEESTQLSNRIHYIKNTYHFITEHETTAIPNITFCLLKTKVQIGLRQASYNIRHS